MPSAVGTNAAVMVMRTLANGDLIAAGYFTSIEGVAANYIARWDGNTWTPLGGGTDAGVLCLHELPNGDLLVGGNFNVAGGLPAARVARWNGSAWSALGPVGPAGSVTALTSRPNGEIVAAGSFVERVAVWNGTAWTGIGLPPPVGAPGRHTLATLSNGDVIAGGPWLVISGQTVDHAVRWNGTGWSVVPGLFRAPESLVLLASGDLLAAGNFGGPSVLRLVGNSWVGVAPGPGFGGLHALLPLPDGDLLGGGSFLNMGTATPMNNIARFRSQSGWSTFGAGTDNRVYSLGRLRNGEILVSGDFATVDGMPSVRLARLLPTCPAAATTVSGNCTGIGAGLNLQAVELPWLGATMRTRASGLPANALAVRALGTQAVSVPLALVLPQAASGCLVRLLPDVLLLALPNNGIVDGTVTIPNTPVLVGQVLFEQVAAVALDATGAIVGAAVTNGLVLTIGVL